MSEKAFVAKNFSGGWATDKKVGIPNSFAYSESIDFRKSPSQFSVLPGPRREDQGNLHDLIQNQVIVSDGTIYACGNAGYFYKRTTAGVWSAESSMVPSTFGMDYRQDADAIYVCGRKSVSLYQPISGSPSMKPAYYGSSIATPNTTFEDGTSDTTYTINPDKEDGTQTTAIMTSFSENILNTRYFQSDIEPCNQMAVFIADKGTGNWTLTLHDGLNNTLATKTIANASLNSNSWNNFSFTSATNNQVRLYVQPNARTYHTHITSTVADGTVASGSANNLSTCNLRVYADRLIQTANGMHPMQRFLQYECIGNGNYLSIWEPLSDPPTNAEWLRHKLVFPQEYEVCGLAVFNEYLAIACQRTTTATSTPQDGIIFWWDGLSPTYNYLTKIPEGSPYAIHEYKNVVYYYAGGAWYAIGSPASQPVKIRTMPGTDTEYSGANPQIVVNPYSATVRNGIHMLGWPSTTVNTSINFGVYSWGAIDKNFPDSFGYSYPISTGAKNYSAQNNLTIGMVKSYGTQMWTSWRDDLNGGYGIDIVDNSSTPTAFASWESLIEDNGFPGKEKMGAYVQATFATLPSDCSFKLKYKLNRATDWTYSDLLTAVDLPEPRIARFDITGDAAQNRFNEVQTGIDLYSGTTTPVVTQMALIFDDLRSESLIG